MADGSLRFRSYARSHPAVMGAVDDEFGAIDGMEFLGADEDGTPIYRARPRFRRPMLARCQHNNEVGADDEFGADDGIGADDAEQLSGYDEEIDELGADDDDVLGADGNEDIGASFKKLEKKEDRLEALLKDLKRELARTPSRRRTKRRHLKERIEKVEAKLGRTKDKKSAKVAKGVAATGRSEREVRAALESGSMNVWNRRQALLAPEAQRGFLRVQSGDTAAGARTTIRLIDSTTRDSFSSASFVAAAGHRSTTIAFESDQISYERLRVVGVEFTGQIAPTLAGGAVPIDTAPELMMVTLQADGYADQVTTETPVLLEKVVSPGGLISFRGSWNGLRQPIYLDKRDTVTGTYKVGQLRTNAANVDWTVQLALIVDILSDEQVR